MTWSGFHPAISRIPCANGPSLAAIQETIAIDAATRIIQNILRGRLAFSCRGWAEESATAASGAAFAGKLTGCPHLRQNWDPSGKFAEHWLHNTGAFSNPLRTADSSTERVCGVGALARVPGA